MADDALWVYLMKSRTYTMCAIIVRGHTIINTELTKKKLTTNWWFS